MRSPPFLLPLVCLALGILGGHGVGSAKGQEKPGVDALVPQVTAANPFARLAAIGQVAELGPQGAPAAPALLEALRCERMDVLFETPQVTGIRQSITDALVKLGPTSVPQLEKALQDPNGLVRVGAATALYRINPVKYRDRVLPVLSAALKAEDEAASDAAQALESLGNDAAPAIPELLRQLAHDDMGVRCQIGHALAALAGDASAARLQSALKDASPLQKVGVAYALVKQNPGSLTRFQDLLTQGLKDSSPEVRQQAVWAICQLGPIARPLARDLIGALGGLNPDPREYFFGGGKPGRQSFDPSLTLVALGPEVKDSLLEALESSDARTRLLAAIALVRIDPTAGPRVTEIFQQGRQENNQSLRMLAEMNAAPPHPGDSPDIEQLIEELIQSNGFGPPSPAMGQLMRKGAEAVAPLMKVLDEGDGQAAQRISQVLGAIGAPAIPALTKALQSDLPRQRLYAVNALAAMGPASQPLLIEALQDDAYPVRRAARHALRALNTPEAREALQHAADHR